MKEKENMMKKKEAPTIKLNNGKVVSSAAIIPTINGGANGANKQENPRKFLHDLKNIRLQQRSHNVTIDTIKQTF